MGSDLGRISRLDDAGLGRGAPASPRPDPPLSNRFGPTVTNFFGIVILAELAS